ncbi:hypothetical protein LPJ66_008276 [Kickxella alabastrina]|uniref:Uncharacterized protein n=1 Tax=Kickxella alabastrina TaxID=61397 RepID=A0ACC1IA53_9FUNG|nr:hypothetical protein LPJ66_008276 [Kickxella alabastrina]
MRTSADTAAASINIQRSHSSSGTTDVEAEAEAEAEAEVEVEAEVEAEVETETETETEAGESDTSLSKVKISSPLNGPTRAGSSEDFAKATEYMLPPAVSIPEGDLKADADLVQAGDLNMTAHTVTPQTTMVGS